MCVPVRFKLIADKVNEQHSWFCVACVIFSVDLTGYLNCTCFCHRCHHFSETPLFYSGQRKFGCSSDKYLDHFQSVFSTAMNIRRRSAPLCTFFSCFQDSLVIESFSLQIIFTRGRTKRLRSHCARAIFTSLQTFPSPTVTTTPVPTIAKSPSLRLCLMYADPDIGGRLGSLIFVITSSCSTAVVKRSTKNSFAGTTRSPFLPLITNEALHAANAVGKSEAGSA